MATTHFTVEVARRIGDTLGVDLGTVDLEQFRVGLRVELEHGWHDPRIDVTHDDPRTTGKIAWARLKEFADYYIEATVKPAWSQDAAHGDSIVASV